jgi:hypothetical protein
MNANILWMNLSKRIPSFGTRILVSNAGIFS